MTVSELTGTDPLINRTIEGYHFIKRLGEGTYGLVYLARHPRIKDRLVAVKYIKVENPDEIRSVEREVEVLARLQHPNVVDIYDTYRFDHYQLIVMELVRGGSLLSALQRLQKPLELKTAIDIVEQLAFALGYVHGQDVLHLDLKPANILLDPIAAGQEARPLLTDFGIARIVNPGGLMSTNILGTPMYMSPEHFGFGDNKPDHRSDIYSLGIVLYELIVGEVPFRSSELLEILNHHAYSPVPLPSSSIPSLPPALDVIIMKALAKSPEERFQSATEMGSALREVRLGPLMSLPPLPDRVPGEALGAIALENAGVMEATSAQFPVEEEATAFGLLVMGPDGGREMVNFRERSITVGRDRMVDLHLNHPSISRQHARIDCDSNGNLFVTNLQSTNGTYLDGVRLPPGERVPWKNTQYLQIQGYLLQIEGVPGDEAPSDPFVYTTDQVMVLLDELQKQRARPTMRVTLSPDIVYLEPGKQQYIQVQVSPENTPLARYELRAKPGPGLDERWYTLPAGHVIPAGDTYVFDLVVSAPSTGTIGGHTYEIALEIVADRPGIRSAIQILKVRIVPITRFVIALRPNEVSHNRRRRADLVITNSGNQPETFAIEIEAPDTLHITPEAPQVQVDPAAERTVRLRFKPARGAVRRGRLVYAVTVHAASGVVNRAHGSYVFQRRERVPAGLLVVWALLVIIIARQFIFGVPLPQQLAEVRAVIEYLIQIVTG